MTHVETLIIGAGVSGLSTAAALGRGADLVVLERDSEIGGYCKTVKKDGFVWDYSGHFFHFKNRDIEQWLVERMPGQNIRKVEKKSFISYAGRQIDFPFQKNIHQLPQQDFIDCLYDLYFARAAGMPQQPENNFKEMLYARFGKSIAEKFLIPYNEKLYATDLATLDRDAMGRFFPFADLTDIVKNMRQADNASYNATFTYPEGGAIEYVKAIASEVEASSIHLNEGVESIDLENKIVRTSKGEYRFENLVTSAPFPSLLKLCGLPVDEQIYTWNQVLVFNLGFDSKGPKDTHWVYFPDRSLAFYRIGFYDNIFDHPRMSLYVEVGFPRGAKVDVDATREQVLDGLRREGVITTQKLVAEQSVLMNPAYVHITRESNTEVATLKQQLAANGVHSIGRYGSWTYCSIEDNIIEARQLVASMR
ncbi:MAG: LPS biosynthesis protein [Archangium gephyra]|uniref:LPS biosynthesis protein n=1 Tax=Archangium gephyra TaxID=48 RepID=A0A2W5VLT2_9BACT|nr:MAG: LPS biosynthesis protein [Archangium gephyra]